MLVVLCRYVLSLLYGISMGLDMVYIVGDSEGWCDVSQSLVHALFVCGRLYMMMVCCV